jgi:hypothetical protein
MPTHEPAQAGKEIPMNKIIFAFTLVLGLNTIACTHGVAADDVAAKLSNASPTLYVPADAPTEEPAPAGVITVPADAPTEEAGTGERRGSFRGLPY